MKMNLQIEPRRIATPINMSMTITPVVKNSSIQHSRAPDLTFHCICCDCAFDNPNALYDHMGKYHSTPNSEHNPEQSAENMDQDDDTFEYSSIMEPICELIHSEDDDDDDSDTPNNSFMYTKDNFEIDPNEYSYDKALDFSMPTRKVINQQTDENSSRTSNGASMQRPRFYDDWCDLKVVPAETSITIKEIPDRRISEDVKQLISNCFQCSQCEKSFQNAGDLAKHVRSHTLNKPYQCSICEKTFTHIGSLSTHIRIHSGEKPYKCEVCSKAFTQSSSLMVHLRSHAVKKPHQCHLCDKGFINSSSLVLHLKTHSEGTSYVCVKCDKEFKHPSLLAEHIRLHSYDLVYQCSICQKAYKHSSELVQHMKCHTGEKPFQCSICEKSFTQPGSLNTHMRIHTGERPFHCRICDKTFTQASSLTVHMKIHNNEKPFSCHICGKAYSQQSYLNKHIQYHMDTDGGSGSSVSCIVCSANFKDPYLLAQHVAKEHEYLFRNVLSRQRN